MGNEACIKEGPLSRSARRGGVQPHAQGHLNKDPQASNTFLPLCQRALGDCLDRNTLESTKTIQRFLASYQSRGEWAYQFLGRVD
jgi:hypothetical protein